MKLDNLDEILTELFGGKSIIVIYGNEGTPAWRSSELKYLWAKMSIHERDDLLIILLRGYRENKDDVACLDVDAEGITKLLDFMALMKSKYEPR